MPPKATEKPTAETKAAENAKALSTARSRDLEAAISTITKSYGDGAIMRLGDARAQRLIEVVLGGRTMASPRTRAW